MFLDTANVFEIQRYQKSGLFEGVTTNPTILSREHKNRNSQINELLQLGFSLVFVQLLGETLEEFKVDFEQLQKEWQNETALGVKVPLNLGGLEFIHYIKQQYPEKKVLGTAIYSADQAILGSLAGCDYLALYVNRMEDNNLDPFESIAQTRKFIESRKLKTQIMAASFKNTNQIIHALDSGAHTVTIPPNLFEQMVNKKLAESAIKQFNEDGKQYI